MADSTTCNSELENLLTEIGLGTLLPKFIAEKIDVNVLICGTDQDLIRLGVSTIGDSVRLGDACRRRTYDRSSSSHGGTSSTAFRPATSLGNFINQERTTLFTPRRNTSSSRKRANPSGAAATSSSVTKKTAGARTWTGSFLCLADANVERTPTASEKIVLQNAELGMKKIKLDLDATEKEVHDTLISPAGFLKLKDCGGFELLRCIPNCKILESLTCSMTAKDLKSVVGQAFT